MATSQPKKNSEEQADPSEVKRKLAWRMGFAGLMIVGLLGALALFDRLSSPGESEPAPPQFSEPVPVAKKVTTQPVTPAEPAPEVVKEAAPEPAKETPPPESTAAPVDRAAPRADRPARPEVAAQPAAPRAAAAPSRSPASTPRPASAAPARSESVPRGEAQSAAEPAAAPTPPRLFAGYAVQAGVFADPRRAEELHARLVLEGIPSTIEARVQVGPFSSRAEAEAARDKLKAMGIDGVLLPPRGARR